MNIHSRIGDYEILEELGRGGMGRVYRARNVISDRIEAMKVLLPELVSRPELESRFLREIKVLATLEHPNIAALRTAMKDGDQLVMIMEFVDGESLSQRLKRGPIPVDEALAYIDQVLDALAYAHGRGVIHRDIKPANMMLAADGLVKLTDFGIARSQNDVTLTAAGTTTGSLPYMSPEQVNAEPTDARSDLYSVGISLYEMVTGQRPFQSDSDFAVMVAHLKEMPRPPIELAPALGAELNAVIMKAIAKGPDERYQTADDFRAALTTVPAFAALQDGAAAVPVPVPVPAASQAATVVNVKRTPVMVTPITPERARTLMNAPAPSAVPPVPPVPVPQPVMRKPANAVLYMAIGGVVAIGALVAAAFYINSAAPASAGTPAATTTTATPATAPAATTPPPASATAAPATPAVTATSPGAATATTPASASPVASDTTGAATPAAAASATAAPPISAGTSNAPATPASALSPPVETTSVAATVAPSAAPIGAGRPLARPRAGAGRLPPAAKRAAARALARQGDTAESAPASTPSTGAVGSTPSQPSEPAVDFDELESEIDQLSARVVAINSSLDNLRRDQSRQGLGLRADMAARQQSMNTNITRAAEAVAQKNAARAQRFKAAAEADIEALERFLGR